MWKKLSEITLPHTSLRLNLLVICEMVLLLLLSLAVLLYFSRQTLKEEAIHNAEQTLEGTVQQIDNVLLGVEQTTYNVYQDLKEHLDEPERMFTYSREIVEANPYISGCAIIFKPNYYPDRELFMAYVHRSSTDLGAEELVAADSFGDLAYTEQVWYTAPMKTKRASWTDPLPEEEDEGVTLSFCLPIFDRQQECVGVVVADLPVTWLSQIILAVKPFAHSYSVLLSGNGSYIIHPDEEKLSTFTVLNQVEEGVDPTVRDAAAAMLAGDTGYKPFRLDGKDWYVFYKPFQLDRAYGMPMDKLRWSVGMVILEDDFIGEHTHLIYLVLAITVVGVLLFFFLCRMLIRRQMKPLRMLTRSAQRIADGHYDETIPNAQREDEIGQLMDHFQQMQRSLASKSAELQQLTAMLTERGEELRRAYGNVQGSDRMKATFLHYMTTQMTVPSDLIERSVMKLTNQYEELTPEEAEQEVDVIKKQSGIVLNLLDHMVEVLKIETKESGKEVRHE